MSANGSPAGRVPSLYPHGHRSRRGSIASLASNQTSDKELHNQVLDKIHSVASQSETLTTFNEFAPPPPSSSNSENKGIAGDIMQNGLSGLYNRFRGAVTGGKERPALSSNKADGESIDSVSIKSHITATPSSKTPVAPSREESSIPNSPVPLPSASSRLQSPTTSSFAAQSSESLSQAMKSSKTSFTSATPGTSKSGSSNRPSITPLSKATASSVIVPTVAPVTVSAFKDGDKGRSASSEVPKPTKRSENGPAVSVTHNDPGAFIFLDARRNRRSTIDAGVESDASEDDDTVLVYHHDSLGGDGSLDNLKKALGNSKTASSTLSSLQATDSSRLTGSSRSTDGPPRPAAIDRITQPRLPGYQASRASSTERSTAEMSPINTSAHNSVKHEFFADDGQPAGYPGRSRIPGTTSTAEGATEVMSTQLERMKNQVLSKEFWMADDTCKECFRCQKPFTAWRRKHHCRTCGWIFDDRCTATISGAKFNVQGSLRVCITCLNVINRRHESSGSDDSENESALPTFFQTQQAKFHSSKKPEFVEGQTGEAESVNSGDISMDTPMMAIPATRRIGDSSNRRSAILEIDAPQLSRPSSSRSLKALSAAVRPPSSGHKRHQSKHNFLGRFKPMVEERAPFHRGVADDMGRKSRLPAFHDDNIIDPDLEPYMSDEGSSADEQLSIFATMNSPTLAPSFENDRSGFGSLLSASKRHRARTTGEKSVSGVSFTSRGVDDTGNTPVGAFTRPNRRRNLSAASNNFHHNRTSPRHITPGFGNLDEELAAADASPHMLDAGASRTRSASMRDTKAPSVELNTASLHHVKLLLHQLLEDANIPHLASWEKALQPILLRCADDVDPNVRMGDDIDIRHYVKLKKIPGGRPCDTSYVSGVVFTKNLALKNMPRSILNPRIVIVSFPIEYQRHQQQFVSLEPMIAQEKEFLRNLVARIASLRPQLLLAHKHVSGLALQYLEEANIAVEYNVKPSVIAAAARFAQTEVISSIDMVALKPVRGGKCAAFEVKTYVHKDIPGKKKTYTYLSGCPKELGCTIVLRGASLPILSKMKHIAEFMIYVVYNLKLETCLMRDELISIPSMADGRGSLSPSRKMQAAEFEGLGLATSANFQDPITAASDKLQAITEAGQQFKAPTEESVSRAAQDEVAISALMQFVDYCAEILSRGWELRKTADGTTSRNLELEAASKRIQLLYGEVQISRPDGHGTSLTDEGSPLYSIGEACTKLYEDLAVRLEQGDFSVSLKNTKLAMSKTVPSKETTEHILQNLYSLKANLLSYIEVSNHASPPQTEGAQKSEEASRAAKLVSAHNSHAHSSQEDHVPEDVPMPTFYADMVAKHQTKILSASPFVKFVQPYLLMKAREQERRLVYLKRLRDQDTFEEHTDNEKSKPQKFQLIKPEMVHNTVKNAPRQIMEVLHAVHDAEYDKALHNYQTQKRQWEATISANSNLFDPYAHQNITVLYTTVCTATSIPCAGPELLALAFYNEHDITREFDEDCTLGQYVEDLCLSANTICTANGCEKRLSEHHRTYVHGEARITVFVEKSPCKIKGLQDSILMWSYCKICKSESQVMPMSESTWKYSLGKYLELCFWTSELRLRDDACPHDVQRDHLRYFGFRNFAIRIHYDPIDLLEIIVPRARITWKVENDLRLKNDMFTKIEERWNRFMASVHGRIKVINIDSVDAQKIDACKAEVERLKKLAQDEHASMLRKLQEKYMESKYYEIIPMNRAIRAMQEKAAGWDELFSNFDTNFFPSERDIRRLAALQLKRMFMDRDESTTSIPSTEVTDAPSDADEKSEKSPQTSLELSRDLSNVSAEEANNVLSSVLEDSTKAVSRDLEPQLLSTATSNVHAPELDSEGIHHLDLAMPKQEPVVESTPSENPTTANSQSPDPSESIDLPALATSTSPFEATLSESVEKLRTSSHPNPADYSSKVSEVSGIPRPSERGPARQSGVVGSPPMTRTQSQPSGTIRRMTPLSAKPSFTKQADMQGLTELSTELQSTSTEPVRPADKKLVDRLGLGTLKNRKAGHSLIPRSVHNKRNESNVSTLAKHFEQLSREFEKERLRDRKQRAAKVTNARVFPKASSKPTVEVYRVEVKKAAEERETTATDEELETVQTTYPDEVVTTVVGGLADLNTNATGGEAGPHSPTDTTITTDDTATEAETDDNQPNASQPASDDEGTVSDADHSLLDDLIPSIAELAESFQKPDTTEVSIELPKHEKSTVMKMLTNFWAERSASGWTALDYPINAADHIFVDEDVIVREDEPSSLIAFTLSSDHYKGKLEDILDQVAREPLRILETNDSKTRYRRNQFSRLPLSDQDTAIEKCLVRETGTHLAYSFVDASARMHCKVFFAEQFDAVRRKCGVADRIVESLSRCLKWDSKGGKTKSVFLKTLDDRLVLKSLSPIETQAFLRFAPYYFELMSESLFHNLPSVIAKMFGFYQIAIKNPNTGTEIKLDVLVMENLFYDRSPTRIFDLKGSMRNRKIQSTGEQNEVLLDENMVEYIYESPLFVREHSKKALRDAIRNDTLFLELNDVMDYSLMVAVDEVRKELVVGIIDVVRTYTWDKKLEYWIKDRGFAGGNRNRPTITSPAEYKARFREAMDRYLLQAPNSWHQWQTAKRSRARETTNEDHNAAQGGLVERAAGEKP